MKPKSVTLTLAVDRDGICAAQQAAGAGDLTIDGALASGGAFSQSTAQQVGIYSAGNLAGVTFTVYGTGYDSSGRYSASLSDAVTGPNNSTVETTSYYMTVSRVAVSGAVGSDVEVGPVDEAVSQIIPINRHAEFSTGLQTIVSGTINYDVEYTMCDVQGTSTLTWAPATNMDDATASATSAINAAHQAVRVRANSGNDTGAVTLKVVCP